MQKFSLDNLRDKSVNNVGSAVRLPWFIYLSYFAYSCVGQLIQSTCASVSTSVKLE